MILVSAPAGSAKTTLLASLDVEKAWLQLEPGTRVDPPLRLGRLRVQGRVAEIRGADLRFERHVFANSAGLLLINQSHPERRKSPPGLSDGGYEHDRRPDQEPPGIIGSLFLR